MKPYISPLTIELAAGRYAITDGKGDQLISLDRLFDAAICLRFIMGKSMSRIECDLAESLLREHEARQPE